MWQKLGFFFCLVSLVSCVGHNGADVLTHPQEHASCNKALCASIVSYCMIQEKCGCHPRKNCSCCTECAICLGDHYMQCCDCVGMRRGSNYSSIAPPTVLSTVGVLDEPEPALYRSLTDPDQPMPRLRCTVLRFPVINELTPGRQTQTSSNGASSRSDLDHASQSFWNDVQVVLQHNHDTSAPYHAMCTATYFDRCIPLNECKWSCERMGATSFRWFHNGCCECAGSTCLNYGNRFPKCAECMQ